MSEYSDDIRKTIAVLRRGGVILYPTDTVWGLGCDARNSEAVARIFSIKKRADSKALITLVGSLAQLERTVDNVPDVAYNLIEYSTRPLTIVYDRAAPGAGLATALLAQDGSLGVRVTCEDFSKELCLSFGAPIVSTSANISGEPAPAVFGQISQDIIEAVDYACTSRRNETGPASPSTVMRLGDGGIFKIIRP